MPGLTQLGRRVPGGGALGTPAPLRPLHLPHPVRGKARHADLKFIAKIVAFPNEKMDFINEMNEILVGKTTINEMLIEKMDFINEMNEILVEKTTINEMLIEMVIAKFKAIGRSILVRSPRAPDPMVSTRRVPTSLRAQP